MKPGQMKLGALTLGLVTGGYYLATAQAAGIPMSDALVYSGVLDDTGSPVVGTVTMRLSLFDDETIGSQRCTTGPVSVGVDAGRFEIPLPAACVDAVELSPDLWVEITVENTVLPRTRISAVPYAVESGRANEAAGALDTRIASLEGVRDLPAGTTLSGQTIATGPHFTSSDAVAAMGAVSPTNPLNHARYTNAEAVAAMGANQDSNPLHHDRYTDGEAIAAMGATGDSNPRNHDRYTDMEAVSAMGSKADSNPLNHDKYVPTTTYVNWGAQTCPGSATLVYAGYAAGAHYSHAGGGANTLCLPAVPEWGDSNVGDQNGALLYGAEYVTSGYGLSTAAGWNGYDATCAVCEVPRAATLMIPARTTCPSGWTSEYTGYLMAQHYTQPKSEFVCVNGAPALSGSASSTGGVLFYPTEVECGTLPCTAGGYVQNRELACVVCTK